jgi:four helix bundle protein
VFACAVAKLALHIEPRPGLRCIVDQLLKSVTSVGANLEEAKAGSSREATYWLRICIVLQVGPSEELTQLAGEASQISRILGSIVVKTKLRSRAGLAVFTVFAFCILNFALLFS